MNDLDINILNSFVNPLGLRLNMRSLADLARQRITGWMAGNRQITQDDIAEAVGVSQSWVSLYKSGGVDADLDQLDALARVYNHTLFEVLDLRPNPKENELIEAYRKIRAEARPLAIQLLQQMIPPTSGRGRTRGRNDE